MADKSSCLHETSSSTTARGAQQTDAEKMNCAGCSDKNVDCGVAGCYDNCAMKHDYEELPSNAALHQQYVTMSLTRSSY